MMWLMPTLGHANLLTRSLGLALLGAAVGGGGCGEAPAWVWDQRVYQGPGGSAGDRHASMDTPPPRTDPGVVVFARSGFVADERPEASRRDAQFAGRSPEVLPNRLAWPTEARPDLRRTGTVRTSRSAEIWVYPDTRRDTYRRGYPVYRGYHGSHGW